MSINNALKKTDAKKLYWPEENKMANSEKEDQINFEIDPNLKRKFKAFCALKNVSIKDCLTTYVEKCIETIKR